MTSKTEGRPVRSLVAILCTFLLLPGEPLAIPSSRLQAPVSSPQNQAPKISPEQLDSLVAPIALYPDPLLAQILAASTYPLEIILLQQWLEKNNEPQGQSTRRRGGETAVGSERPGAGRVCPTWSSGSADDIQWTADLGNAFLAQQSDVMDAVQRMRKKAQDKGNLKTTEQQKVETKVVENKSVIVIEQANPQVVYVPSYNPVVVYGPAVLSLSADLLSAVGLLRRGHGDFVRRRRGDGGVLERRLGLGLRLGRQQRHQHQRQQQFQSQLEYQSRQPALESSAETVRIVGDVGNRVVAAVSRAGAATNGSTTRSIAAARHIETALPRTGSAALREVIRLPNARPAPGNRVGRQGGNLASNVERAGVGDRAGGAGVSDRGQEAALAIGPAVAEPIESAAGISRAAAAETGMLSEAAPEDTADRARAAAAAAAPPAWDLEAVAEAVVEARGGGGRRR